MSLGVQGENFLSDKRTHIQEGVGVERSEPVTRRRQGGYRKGLWCGIPLFSTRMWKMRKVVTNKPVKICLADVREIQFRLHIMKAPTVGCFVTNIPRGSGCVRVFVFVDVSVPLCWRVCLH